MLVQILPLTPNTLVEDEALVFGCEVLCHLEAVLVIRKTVVSRRLIVDFQVHQDEGNGIIVLIFLNLYIVDVG